MSNYFNGNNSNSFIWDGNSKNFSVMDGDGNSIQYTWHHHQNGNTLFPVPTKIHNANAGGFNHSGGATILKWLLENIF